ncbi:MAG TPA: hypothetical protein ENJ41_03320 [Oceanospirillales bacterium]|nr:hypothetical protein [Oceanospirillales bacterium]
MKTRHLLVFILFSLNGLRALADDGSASNFRVYDPNPLSSFLYDDPQHDWIKTQNNDKNHFFSLEKNQDITYGEQFAIAWNLSNSFSINLSVFENQLNSNYRSNANRNVFTPSAVGFQSKSLIAPVSQPQAIIDVNRSISGYKLGISSEFGIGHNYKLNFNFDYGQLEDANLIGFNSNEINTSSFAFGIRNKKFGASLNTDIFLENNVDLKEHSRLGLELDWHFSDYTTISVGTKQRLNNSSYLNQSDTLDNLTGNVQYIKFKHNL